MTDSQDPGRPQAFYIRDGEYYVPTGLGHSAWNPEAQGGAPLSGLTAELLDRVPTPVAMMPQRPVVADHHPDDYR